MNNATKHFLWYALFNTSLLSEMYVRLNYITRVSFTSIYYQSGEFYVNFNQYERVLLALFLI